MMRTIKTICTRGLALFVTLTMCLSLMQITAFAGLEETEPVHTGLCALHHPEHTAACGYVPAVDGTDCSHVHTDDCYSESVECRYVPADMPEGAPEEEHICSEETGCVTRMLTCSHAEAGVHDGFCGYAEAREERPCASDCTRLHEIQHLLDALPDADDVTAETAGEVRGQLGVIEEARKLLEDGQWESLDRTRYDAVLAALEDLDSGTYGSDNSALQDFLAALDEIAEATDLESTLAAVEACLEAYQMLSDEEKAAYADEYRYLLDYQAELAADGEEENFLLDDAVAQIGETYYSTLQAAVDAVSSGETIYLLGDVTENIYSKDRSYTLDMGEHTIRYNAIQGTSYLYVYWINGGTVELKNGTFSDGRMQNNSHGAGLAAFSAAVQVTNCTFTGNEAKHSGAGIYASNSAVSITGGTFSGNTAKQGSVIYATGGTFTMDGATISGNTGLALKVEKPTAEVSLKNVTIKDNTFTAAKQKVAMVEISVGAQGFQADGCTIQDNRIVKGTYPQTIFSIAGSSSTEELAITGCTITGNSTAGSVGSSTLGLNVTDREISMSNCEITGNTSAGVGGIRKLGTASNPAAMTITASSIIVNTGGIAGGMYLLNGSTIAENTVIKNNTSTGATAYSAGGVSLGDGYNAKIFPSFTLQSGALYDNGTDVSVGPKGAAVTAIAPSDMSDSGADKSFANHVWTQTGGSEEYPTLDVTTTSDRLNFTVALSRNLPVATVENDEAIYTTIPAALDAANGRPVTLVEGADSAMPLTAAITVSQDAVLNLNSRTLMWLNASDTPLLEVQSGALTLNGPGGVTGGVSVNAAASLTVQNGAEVSLITNNGDATLALTTDVYQMVIHNGASLTVGGTGRIAATLGQGKSIIARADFAPDSKWHEPIVLTLEGVNVNAPDADVTLLQCASEEQAAALASRVTVTGLTDPLVKVVADGQNVVLRETKLASGIYLDGKNGNDSNSGLAPEQAVKTFAKAKEVLTQQNGTIIYVTGTVEVTGTEEWSLPEGAQMKAYPYTSTMVLVKSGGNLTLSNITLDGGKEDGFVTYGALVEVENNGQLNIQNGAVLQNNDRQWRSGDATGGAVENHGTMAMYGGFIRNNVAQYGGGVYTGDTGERRGGYPNGVGTFTLSGGVIENNAATDDGGGIMVGYSGSLILYGKDSQHEGAKIQNNTAGTSGGGISLGGSTNAGYAVCAKQMLTMWGGEISGNHAKGEGGGLFVQKNGTAAITAGQFTNNSCEGKGVGYVQAGAYGGGAIYVNGGPRAEDRADTVDGMLRIADAHIYNNTAADAGGGIAGCPTSTIRLNREDGSVIYGNTGGRGLAQDVFVDQVDSARPNHWQYLSGYLPNGAAYNWTDPAGNLLNPDQLVTGDVISANSGLDASNPLVKEMIDKTTVLITGNTSEVKGGGIGSNGIVIIGSGDGTSVLRLEKKVEGETNTTEFAFTIGLTGVSGDKTAWKVSADRKSSTEQTITFTNGSANVSLKDGEYILLTGIPVGTAYTVTETTSGASVKINGKDVSDAVAMGTVSNAAAELLFTNIYPVGYVVHYVEQGTNAKLHEDASGTVSLDESKEITAEEIDGYELIAGAAATQTVSAQNREVTFYYTKRTVGYSIEYYYNGVKDADKTVSGTAKFQDVITSYTDKIVEGYKLDKTENLPLTIKADASDNVIKVYYVTDDGTTKTLSYTVEYYKDGKKVEADTQIEHADVQVLQPDTMTVDKSKINTVDKYEGYKLDAEATGVIPDTVNNRAVIKVYYVKRTDLSYTVKYLEWRTGSELHPAKTEDNHTFGEVIRSADERIAIAGYTYYTASPDELTIGTGINEMTLYYTRNSNGGTPIPTPTPTPTPTPAPTPNPAPSPDPGSTITDQDVPLANAVGLNDTEHFAYIIGYEDDTVRPENNISRAEVATIFFRLMTEEYRAANWAADNNFTDVRSGDWYNNAISTCANAGALKGRGDGSYFDPNANITRAEFAAIAARFLDESIVDDGKGDFSDTADHWAAKEIRLAAKAGWVTGSGNKFRPNDNITRAEVMTIVNRMLDRTPDKDHMLPTMKKWIDNSESAWYYEAVQEATNEHDYVRDESNVETWTEILTVRDWKALETEWAGNRGASAPKDDALPVEDKDAETYSENE